MTRFATFAAAVTLAAAPLIAHAEAQEQRVEKSIVINAPPDAVWAIAGDFVGLPRWYPPIPSARLVLGRNNEVGCIRELTRANGTKVEEKLIDYSPWDRSLTYTYAGGEPLSSDYFATLTVKDADGGKSLVEWKARFKRLAYWTDNPPPGQDDETVRKALNAGYQLGLESLKKLAESGQ
jgi:mxaD protein